VAPRQSWAVQILKSPASMPVVGFEVGRVWDQTRRKLRTIWGGQGRAPIELHELSNSGNGIASEEQVPHTA
jgi:hypothetical protein